MRNVFAGSALVMVALAGSTACRKPASSVASRTVPPGTLQIRFTRPIQGPLELMVDGTRIPVEHKGKKFQELTVTGLSAGKHRYFLSSPRDAFGPDQGEVELTAEKGVYLYSFAQRFNAVLYGQPEPTPVAEGLPGVKALLAR